MLGVKYEQFGKKVCIFIAKSCAGKWMSPFKFKLDFVSKLRNREAEKILSFSTNNSKERLIYNVNGG